ncbi:hypothetical protein R1CP_21000 [Rhodococcus opacus]|uniref:Uncharacterized protein n=1 Tax=Rhodococcus opacus TaxID=37919 RepID=A0A1B1K8J2_RHOOP|nr:hypothetical protein [Rhodococcus opacus]ANS28878.1 hypothetical protein R1CP_21000 [Rhodococcus opacus]
MQRLFIRHGHTPATVRGELGTRVPGLGRSQGEARLRPELTFQVEPEVIAHTRNARERDHAAGVQTKLPWTTRAGIGR